jgi:PBP1b-binding outer membrane lipoprotein LpoB
MRRLALLVLIALLAAGCDEGRHKQTEAERVKMENEFSQVAMNIANATITSGPADETTMEQFTNDYIALRASTRTTSAKRRSRSGSRTRSPRSNRGAFSAACSSIGSARSTDFPRADIISADET